MEDPQHNTEGGSAESSAPRQAMMPPGAQHLRAAMVPFTISALAGILCWVAAGSSLGLFFGGIAFVSLLAPPLIMSEDALTPRFVAAGAVIDAMSLIWFVAMLFSAVTFFQWMACYAVLAAYVLALGAIASVLAEKFRLGATIASALTTIVALAWLSWPFWLAAALRGPAGAQWVQWLVPLHPLFAVNGVLRQLGIWTEMPIAYRWMNLGDDVPYVLPASVLTCVLLHLVIAVGCGLLVRGSRASSSPQVAR